MIELEFYELLKHIFAFGKNYFGDRADQKAEKITYIELIQRVRDAYGSVEM
jgi:hypothetical protein